MALPYILIEKSVVRKPNSTKTIQQVLDEAYDWMQELQDATSVDNKYFYAEVVDSETLLKFNVYSTLAKDYFELESCVIELGGSSAPIIEPNNHYSVLLGLESRGWERISNNAVVEMAHLSSGEDNLGLGGYVVPEGGQYRVIVKTIIHSSNHGYNGLDLRVNGNRTVHYNLMSPTKDGVIYDGQDSRVLEGVLSLNAGDVITVSNRDLEEAGLGADGAYIELLVSGTVMTVYKI